MATLKRCRKIWKGKKNNEIIGVIKKNTIGVSKRKLFPLNFNLKKNSKFSRNLSAEKKFRVWEKVNFFAIFVILQRRFL